MRVVRGSILALSLVGCHRIAPPAPASSYDFRTTAEQFARSTAQHDPALVTSFFDDSVFVVSPQGRQPVVGRDASTAAWARFFAAGNPAHTMTVDTASASGALGYSRGHWTVGMDTPGGRAEAAGVYLAVWRRTGSVWRIVELSVFTAR